MFDYNNFYKTQDSNFLAHPERHALVSTLCHGHVADIGCCMGILSDYYSGQYSGFDIAESALKNARQIRRSDARFIQFDCSDLSGLEIERYDTFVFAEFLEHFSDDDNILGPIFSRHKQGARIVITIPNGDRVPDPSHLRSFTIPQLRKKFSPYGLVKFYNWPGAKLQTVMTVDLGIQSPNLLSLVMIAKNEFLGLEKAILSTIDIVDNIVVAVDNSSSDATLKIAERYADTLKTFDWCDDFSWARNFAHDGVKTKWILFLDGHEFVKARPSLETYLSSNADGLLCSVEMDDGSIIRNPRIYKNGVEFVGKIHEQQQCKSVIAYPGFVVKHDRIGSQSKEGAHARHLQSDDMIPRIMGERLRMFPGDIRASFHLALHAQSRKNYKAALKYQNQYFKFSTVKSERWFMFFNRALCYCEMRFNRRALASLNFAEKQTPNRWEVAKLRGIIYYSMKKFALAAQFLVDSFNENIGDVTYKPWPRDDSSTYNLIGECLFNLGDYYKAHVAFFEASKQCEKEVFKKLFKDRSDLMLKIAESQK